MRFFATQLHIFKLGVNKSLQFRVEIWLWMLLDLASLLVFFFIWASIYGTQTGVTHNSYSLPQVLQYYLLGTLIYGLTGSHFENWRVGEIREGKIDFYLTRPFSYPMEIFWRDIADKAVHLCLKLPLYLVAWLILAATFQLPAWPNSPLVWVQLVGLLAFGYGVEFLLACCAVFLGFWLEGSEGLEHFKFLAIGLLSGSMIPLTFMPYWMRELVEILPLKYMYAYPIGLVQGSITLTSGDVAYAALTLATLTTIAWTLWRLGRYHYTSHGG